MEIDFFVNFYKKKNSTKRPVVGGLVDRQIVQGNLKEPCSILHPVVSFQAPIQTNMHDDFFRYAYIPAFSRYYWVKDWTWNNGLWVCSMEVDVLATYRGDIGEQTEYILRTDSSTSDFNGAISDRMYPATTDFDVQNVAYTTPYGIGDSISNGTYVVGIIAGANTATEGSVGAVAYYAMTVTEFSKLRQVLFGEEGLEDMGLIEIIQSVATWKETDMTENIFKTMYNPYQYIVSCTWFPVGKTDMVGAQQTGIKVGWWMYDSLSGKKLTQFTGVFNWGTQHVPNHPQAPTRGKYLNYAPYTKVTLWGKFGSIPIDTSYIEVGDYVTVLDTVDFITGQCLTQVFVSDNPQATGRVQINKTEYMLGVPIQLAQIGRDYLGAVTSAVDAGVKAAEGGVRGFLAGGAVGAVVGAIGSAGGAIANTIETAMPQMMTSGINGSFISIGVGTIMTVIHYVIVDEDIAHKGRPLCEMRRIDTLTGFVLCGDGEIDLNAYDEEREAVSRFLLTGFFWE